jgi:uracil-DNA glycosylase family 4
MSKTAHYGKDAPSEKLVFISKLKPEIREAGGKQRVTNDSFRPECITCPLFDSSLRVGAEIIGNEVLFIGEAPGRNERTTPFQGEAGEILRGILDSDRGKKFKVRSLQFRGTGLKGRYSVGNTVNCRPFTHDGKNRAPSSSEINHCKVQLLDLIEKVKPRVLVIFGNTALETLLPNVKGSIMSIRGRFYDSTVVPGIPVFPIIHPAAPLHSESQTIADSINNDIDAVSRWLGGDKNAAEDPTYDIRTISTEEEVQEIVRELEAPQRLTIQRLLGESNGDVVLDFENAPDATDLYSNEQRLLTASFTYKKDQARVLVLEHPESDCSVFDITKKIATLDSHIDELLESPEIMGNALDSALAERDQLQEKLVKARKILEFRFEAQRRILRAAKRIIAHNAGYEAQLIMRFLGFDFFVEIQDKLHCSMLLHQEIDPHGPKALDDIGAAIGYRPWKNAIGRFFKSLPTISTGKKSGRKKQRYSFDKVPLSILIPYTGMDTIVTFDSWERDEVEARKRGGPWHCYDYHKQPAMVEIAHMRRNGMAVDEVAWGRASTVLKGELEAAEGRFYFHHDFLSHYLTQMGVRGKIENDVFLPETTKEYFDKIQSRFKHRSTAQMSSLLYKSLGWQILGHGKNYPQKRIQIAEADGIQKTFVIKGMRKRGRSLKLIDLDYTYDHKVEMELGRASTTIAIDKITKWDLRAKDSDLDAGIPLNQCRIVKYGYKVSKKGGFERYDKVVFGTPPPIGSKIYVSCVQKSPSVNSGKIGDYITLYNMGQTKYELARCLLTLAQKRKLYGVYVEPTLRKRSKGDNLIHPKFNAYGTVTGRHSSEWHTLPWDDMLKSMYVSKFRDSSSGYKQSTMLTSFFESSLRDLNPEGLRDLSEAQELMKVLAEIRTNGPDKKSKAFLKDIFDKPPAWIGGAGKKIKEALKAYEMLLNVRGGIMISADEAQLELRVGAGLSGDKQLMQIFIDGALDPQKPEQWATIEKKYGKPGMSRQAIIKNWALWTDPHRVVASQALSKPIEKVTEGERRFCKMIHFGIFYLRTARSTASQLYEKMRTEQVIYEGGNVDRRIVVCGYPPEELLWVKINGKKMPSTFTKDAKVVGRFNIDLGFTPSPEDEIEITYSVNFDELVKYCQEMIDGYYEKYYGVKEFQLNSQKSAQKKNRIDLPTGRQIPMSERDSRWNRSVWPVNYPVQGTSSDLVTHFMVMIARTLRGQARYLDLVGKRAADKGRADVVRCIEEIGHRGGIDAHVVNTVHDSIISDSRIEVCDFAVPVQRFIMEDITDFEEFLRVPLKADTAIGMSIGQKIELDPYKFADTGARLGRAGISQALT